MTTSNEATATARAAYTAGLRELADLLDANPHLALPLDGSIEGLAISVHVTGAEDQRSEMAAWSRALPGTKTKQVNSNYFYLRKTFGGGLYFKVVASRDEVCERVVVGTHEVTEEVVDPAYLAEAPTIVVTKTVEDVEWRCNSILDDAAAVH